eukprot:SAG22_NODE_174_length_16466_cov_34.991568_18_plen_80_part_00
MDQAHAVADRLTNLLMLEFGRDFLQRALVQPRELGQVGPVREAVGNNLGRGLPGLPPRLEHATAGQNTAQKRSAAQHST